MKKIKTFQEILVETGPSIRQQRDQKRIAKEVRRTEKLLVEPAAAPSSIQAAKSDIYGA